MSCINSIWTIAKDILYWNSGVLEKAGVWTPFHDKRLYNSYNNNCESIHSVRPFFNIIMNCVHDFDSILKSYRTSRKYEFLELDQKTKSIPFHRKRNAMWKSTAFDIVEFCSISYCIMYLKIAWCLGSNGRNEW